MKVKVGESEVDLSATHLTVNEESLNDHMKSFASIYAYYNAQCVRAQFIQHITEDKYDQILSEKYQGYKENGDGSDKLCEAKAKVSDKVITALRNAREAKYIAQLMYAYMRSLDKAHECALNLG